MLVFYVITSFSLYPLLHQEILKSLKVFNLLGDFWHVQVFKAAMVFYFLKLQNLLYFTLLGVVSSSSSTSSTGPEVFASSISFAAGGTQVPGAA